MSWHQMIIEIFTYSILIYSALLLTFYVFVGIYSIGETQHYVQKNSLTDYTILAASTAIPGISIIAPAYNEEATIIENVRSLLSVYYPNMELLIVNDGSKDTSLQKLIDTYQLQLVPIYINEHIPTKPVRAIYKSINPVFNKLVVIDKENGGKADALNVGINLSTQPYVACIDVDCILEEGALLKMIKPFLESTQKRVIASGGVVRIANSCEIEDGRLINVRLPGQFLPRIQTLEYIRAFLLGRMAWSRLNGLLIISGAFGLFDKDIVIKSGGYNHNTVGEDMELVVRMRRYMEEHKLPYQVTYIPDPLCWTEGPSSLKILGRQRNRWTRGTIETLKFHRRLFFNPRYGILGMVSYPYWFFFEFMAPIIEFLGLTTFPIFAALGWINWGFFLALLTFIISFGIMYSLFAMLMEVLTYNQYKKKREMLQLILTALVEPFIFHPFVVWSAIKGNIDFWRKKKAWGEMTRKGFYSKKSTSAAS